MFKACRQVINIKRRNTNGYIVHDEDGRTIENPSEKAEALKKFYELKFSTGEIVNPFENEISSELLEPITTNEIKRAINKLNNGKAVGPDNIPAELIKSNKDLVSPIIADIFNSSFARNKEININSGNLVLLQKPGKVIGPISNLRPITLLSVFRKVLSTVVLFRIRSKIEQYLSPSQAGFRPYRSTSDIVLAHKWLIARILKYRENFTILGVDMSAAFDTINCSILLEHLKSIVNRDELIIIRYLLADTSLNITCSSTTVTIPTSVGTPQGDSLSPILFIVYLESALRELRLQLSLSTNVSPNELIYADDCDFIFDTLKDAENSVPTIVESLGKFNLKVNASKTEFTCVDRNLTEWRNVKKLGSLLGDKEDLERRKQMATIAFKNLMNIWLKKYQISTKKKMMLYNSLVIPILLYNCSTWSLTSQQSNSLDVFHRRQLRHLLGIFWPEKITNDDLYKRCQAQPLSKIVKSRRLSLLGHILRRDSNIPANLAINNYFNRCENRKYRGRIPTSISQVTDSYIKASFCVEVHADQEHFQRNVLKLTELSDVEKLKSTAENRNFWRAHTGLRNSSQEIQSFN